MLMLASLNLLAECGHTLGPFSGLDSCVYAERPDTDPKNQRLLAQEQADRSFAHGGVAAALQHGGPRASI